MLNSMLGWNPDPSLQQSGTTFCNAIVELHGMAVLNQVWAAPDNLPSYDEIKDPFAWMERVLEDGHRPDGRPHVMPVGVFYDPEVEPLPLDEARRLGELGCVVAHAAQECLGAVEAFVAMVIKERSYQFPGKEQIVIQKYAEALEEIPLTIARNAGMDTIDIGTHLRGKIYSQSSSNGKKKRKGNGHYNNRYWYGINAIDRKIDDMMNLHVVEPLRVKEQVLVTATESIVLLMRVDDVVMKKPVETHGHSHTHLDGTTHSHKGGSKPHDHFDRLGKVQRPMHHYY